MEIRLIRIERGTTEKFKATSRIFPTEDPLKVSAALTNLFPGAQLEVTEDSVTATFGEVDNLARLVTDQKTRYAFLDALNRGCTGNHFALSLNKQAASVSRVNVVDEPKPLGSIEFSGELDEPIVYFEKLLDIAGYVTSRMRGREEGDRDRAISGRG